MNKLPSIPPRISKPIEEGEHPFTQLWWGWFNRLVSTLNSNLAAGYTGTITTAPLTGAGTPGSMTFQNGVVTSQTQAT